MLLFNLVLHGFSYPKFVFGTVAKLKSTLLVDVELEKARKKSADTLSKLERVQAMGLARPPMGLVRQQVVLVQQLELGR